MNLNEIQEFLSEEDFVIYQHALAHSAFNIPVGTETYKKYKTVFDKVDTETKRRKIQLEKMLHNNSMRNLKKIQNKNYLKNFRK